MNEQELRQKNRNLLRFLALGMLVVMPLVYLIVAYFHEPSVKAGSGANDLLFFILLFLALAAPSMAPVIERMQINQFRKRRKAGESGEPIYFSIAIIGMAYAESVFIFGLIVYLITGDFTRMLYFYVIGAVWAAIYWPRDSRREAFLEKVNRP